MSVLEILTAFTALTVLTGHGGLGETGNNRTQPTRTRPQAEAGKESVPATTLRPWKTHA